MPWILNEDVWYACRTFSDVTGFPEPWPFAIFVFGVIAGERCTVEGVVDSDIEVILIGKLILIASDIGNLDGLQSFNVEGTQNRGVVTMVRLLRPAYTFDIFVVIHRNVVVLKSRFYSGRVHWCSRSIVWFTTVFTTGTGYIGLRYVAWCLLDAWTATDFLNFESLLDVHAKRAGYRESSTDGGI